MKELKEAVALVGPEETLRLAYNSKGLDHIHTASLRKASFLEKEYARAIRYDWRKAAAISLIAANLNEAIRIAERGL